MTWWQAIILGIVEGLTEYLPISSTGHLILAQRMMGLEQTAAADAYVVVIQLGAILAVLGLYRQRAGQMLRGLAGRDEVGRHLFICTIVAFIPAAIVGPLLVDWIESHLFGLWPITVAWVVGGAAILGTVVWRRQRQRSQATSQPGLGLEELTWKMALVIGLIQCCAMWPGTSRSLVTIVGGVLVGLRLAAAVEFSFILGVLTLSAAAFYKTVTGSSDLLEHYSVASLVIGMIAAGASAAVAVKWMVAYLNRHSLAVFGYYRIALGVAVGTLILMDLLQS